MTNFVNNVLIIWIYLYIQNVLTKNIYLTDGNIMDIDQPPNSFYFYPINPSLSAKIYLMKKSELPLLYGYPTEQIDNTTLTERELIELGNQGYLDIPYRIHTMSYLKYVKNTEKEKEYSLLVYCSGNVNCTYSIWYKENQDFNILPNQNYIFFNQGSLQIPLDKYLITNNTILKLFVTHIFSYTTFSVTDYLLEKVNVTNQTLSVNDIYYYQLNEDYNEKDLIIQYFPYLQSVFMIKYVIEEKEDNLRTIPVDVGLTDIIDLNSNQEIDFLLNHNKDSESSVFYIKPQNCILNIFEIEEDKIIKAYHNSYYQTIYTNKDSYKIRITINKEESIQTDSCKVIYY